MFICCRAIAASARRRSPCTGHRYGAAGSKKPPAPRTRGSHHKAELLSSCPSVVPWLYFNALQVPMSINKAKSSHTETASMGQLGPHPKGGYREAQHQTLPPNIPTPRGQLQQEPCSSSPLGVKPCMCLMEDKTPLCMELFPLLCGHSSSQHPSQPPRLVLNLPTLNPGSPTADITCLLWVPAAH